MSTLSITVRPVENGAVHIHPAGEIDADNCGDLRETVGGLLATEQPKLIKMDMSQVGFIDSVGIGSLVACYHAAAASGVRLLVINPTAYVHRILYVSGLLGLFGSPAHLPEQGRQPETASVGGVDPIR